MKTIDVTGPLKCNLVACVTALNIHQLMSAATTYNFGRGRVEALARGEVFDPVSVAGRAFSESLREAGLNAKIQKTVIDEFVLGDTSRPIPDTLVMAINEAMSQLDLADEAGRELSRRFQQANMNLDTSSESARREGFLQARDVMREHDPVELVIIRVLDTLSVTLLSIDNLKIGN